LLVAGSDDKSSLFAVSSDDRVYRIEQHIKVCPVRRVLKPSRVKNENFVRLGLIPGDAREMATSSLAHFFSAVVENQVHVSHLAGSLHDQPEHFFVEQVDKRLHESRLDFLVFGAARGGSFV